MDFANLFTSRTEPKNVWIRIAGPADADDDTPLLCGDCGDPIRVNGDRIADDITDARCGCEEFPTRFQFVSMEE